MNAEYVAKLRAEIVHAERQLKAAKTRQRATQSDVDSVTVLLRGGMIRAVKRNFLALQSCAKWTGAIQRAKTSLQIIGEGR